MESAQIEIITLLTHIDHVRINETHGSSEITIHGLGTILHVSETTLTDGDRVKVTITKEPAIA
jgi:hypothetical protein